MKIATNFTGIICKKYYFTKTSGQEVKTSENWYALAMVA